LSEPESLESKCKAVRQDIEFWNILILEYWNDGWTDTRFKIQDARYRMHPHSPRLWRQGMQDPCSALRQAQGQRDAELKIADFGLIKGARHTAHGSRHTI
jgi:hypothetical protein